MRKRLLLLCLLLPATLLAQKKQWLRGQVVTIGENGEKTPEAKLTVTVKETGNNDVTNSQGLFRIFLPRAYKTGEQITFLVDKPGWRIHTPLDGEKPIPADLKKQTVEISLLPVGSKLFWTHDRIEKFIGDLTERAKKQVTPQGKPREIDFGPAIKEWASQYGFNAGQARQEIDKWVAEVEAKRNDDYKLALAEFAKGNLNKAASLFGKSGEFKQAQLAELDELEKALAPKRKRLTAETIQSFRKQGDAFYSSYQFEKALAAYQNALTHISREDAPQLWFNVTLEIGNTHWAIGIRTQGAEVQRHLSAAHEAYERLALAFPRENNPERWASAQVGIGKALQNQGIRTAGESGAQLMADAVQADKNALQVYTREQLPQQWAGTQNNLGNALRDQGIRTTGESGAQLLAEAVQAYKNALQVRTRELLPQQWAMTQNNLGNALRDQGIRTTGESGAQLLAQAVQAYKNALTVRLFEYLPTDWAQTQNNLAKAYETLQDGPNTATSYANVLKVYPDYAKAYQTASYLFHEVLFDFEAAFDLNQTLSARHPDELSPRLDLAVKHFTTGRYRECQQRIAALLAEPEIGSGAKYALQGVAIANQLALASSDAIAQSDGITGVRPRLDTLIFQVASEPDTFKVGWTFNGAKRFIETREELAPYREWLPQLFVALEAGSRDEILVGLRRVQAEIGRLRPVVEK